MNARQARALLELIADLYLVASLPEPQPSTNGKEADDADTGEPLDLAAR